MNLVGMNHFFQFVNDWFVNSVHVIVWLVVRGRVTIRAAMVVVGVCHLDRA